MSNFLQFFVILTAPLQIFIASPLFAKDCEQSHPPLSKKDRKAFSDMHKAHIEFYSPKKEVFHQYMQRDLDTHFSELFGEKVKTKYELLQREAIQIGVGYPYYYVWVRIIDTSNENLVSQGLVGVRGEGATEFGVGRLMSVEELCEHKDEYPGFFKMSLRKSIRAHAIAAQRENLRKAKGR